MKLLDRKPGHDRYLEQSFLTQRRGMAILAGLFPVIFLFSSFVLQHAKFQPTISDYYWTKALERDLFVGVLCAIGVFLVLYKGYTMLEDWVLNVAGVCAACVALVPMVEPGKQGHSLHGVFAVAFFICIFYVVIFMSEKSLDDMRDEKRAASFRWKYHLCAGVMIVSVALAVLSWLLLPEERYRALLASGAVFWFEAIGVWSFAFFWYVKTRELDPSMSWVPFKRKSA